MIWAHNEMSGIWSMLHFGVLTPAFLSTGFQHERMVGRSLALSPQGHFDTHCSRSSSASCGETNSKLQLQGGKNPIDDEYDDAKTYRAMMRGSCKAVDWGFGCLDPRSSSSACWCPCFGCQNTTNASTTLNTTAVLPSLRHKQAIYNPRLAETTETPRTEGRSNLKPRADRTEPKHRA